MVHLRCIGFAITKRARRSRSAQNQAEEAVQATEVGAETVEQARHGANRPTAGQAAYPVLVTVVEQRVTGAESHA